MSAKAVVAAGPARSCAAARSSCRSPPRRPPRAPRAARTRAPACTSRASTTSWCGSRAAARPVPGDEIMGFVTRGRGVSVHRTDCANAAGLRQPGRPAHRGRVGQRRSPATYVVSIEVEALDRSRLLRDVAARAVRAPREHPRRARRRRRADRVAKFRFDFELADPGHLDVDPLRRSSGSTRSTTAYRVLPGHARAAALTGDDGSRP